MAGLTGEIRQVPPAVSAIKVGGQRAYKLTRAGAAPELAARPVTVYQFTVTARAVGEGGGLLDVDATVRCSSGTYIRALARDLGTALGTGGHLTRLRRTRVGGYGVEDSPHPGAAGRPVRGAAAGSGGLGGVPAPGPERGRGPPAGQRRPPGRGAQHPVGQPRPAGRPRQPGPTAAYAPDGTLIALVTEESGQARPLVVFA